MEENIQNSKSTEVVFMMLTTTVLIIVYELLSGVAYQVLPTPHEI